MDEALIAFYYQYHKHQHYFLCHDILEDAWKENSSFSKNDAVVSLILFVTACYHFRRGNTNGALKSYQKSLKVINEAKDSINLQLDIDAFKKIIQTQISSIQSSHAFVPVKLPVYKDFEMRIKFSHPDYAFTSFVVSEPYIMHHHIKRDRTKVIQAREKAKALRQNATSEPYHTLKDHSSFDRFN